MQYLLFAQIGNHVDRIELGNLGQCGLLSSATDEIAGIDQMLAGDAVERRSDLGIGEIQLGQRHLRLRTEQLGLGGRPLIGPCVDIDLGRGILFEELQYTERPRSLHR